MKRIISIALMLMMLVPLAACRKAPVEADASPKPTETAADKTTAAPTDAPTAAPTDVPATEPPAHDTVEIPTEYSNTEQVLSVPVKWYTYSELSLEPELGAEMTYIKAVPDMEIPYHSPEAFVITDDGETAIVDTAGARLCVYDTATGQLKRTVGVGRINHAAPIRVTKSDGVYYVLIPDYNTRIVAVEPDGTTREIPVPQIEEALGYSYVSEFYVEDGRLMISLVGQSSVTTKAVSLEDGSVTSLYTTSWKLSNGIFTVTRGETTWSFPAEPSNGGRLSRIDILKVDGEGSIFVVQEVSAEDGHDVGLYQVFDKHGRLIHCDRIDYFADSYMTVRYGRIVGPDGSLYEMYCNEDEVRIVRIVGAS
ncbi:MAG: hypothetical protein K6F68_01055 [Clostridiales bacterium]|nr:hypothetical protein [Clostridiales bacterium]